MIAINNWQGFRPFAMLSVTAQELQEARGIVFRTAHDELDEVRESAFSGVSGVVYGLVEHVNAPVRGVELLAHDSQLREGALFPTSDALAALRLDGDKVQWSLTSGTGGAAPGRRIVYVCGHGVDRFNHIHLETIRSTIRDEGFHLVGHWEDVGREGRLAEHLRNLSTAHLVLYLAAAIDQWSYYELGIARGLRKPILALSFESAWREREPRPHFDREVRLRENLDATAVRRALHDALRGLIDLRTSP